MKLLALALLFLAACAVDADDTATPDAEPLELDAAAEVDADQVADAAPADSAPADAEPEPDAEPDCDATPVCAVAGYRVVVGDVCDVTLPTLVFAVGTDGGVGSDQPLFDGFLADKCEVHAMRALALDGCTALVHVALGPDGDGDGVAHGTAEVFVACGDATCTVDVPVSSELY